MIELKDLLLRFNSLLKSGELQNENVRSVITEVTGISIKPEDIKIKNATVYLNIKPIYKNEIFLKQEKILSQLRETLGSKSPTTLR